MLMAGAAAARYALERSIPFLFATQDPPEASEHPDSLAGMFALRRTLKRSQQTNVPGPHAGLGLEVYTRMTSPLRRYLDLVGHQQLRAYLHGTTLLGEQEVLERVGAAEAVTGMVRQAELLTEKHWTLVYLLQHPDWRGEGIVVEKRDRRAILLIPTLGLEARVHLDQDIPLNSTVALALSGINLAELDVYFQLVD
jgi:exoribonuclease II